MGNTLAKYYKADWVDGGRVKEKIQEDERPIMVDAWGAPIYAPKEYDVHLVKKLIRQRRLAPFYIAEDVDEATSAASEDGSSGSDDSFSSSKRNKKKSKKIKKNKPNKDDPESLEASFFNENLLNQGFVDCPICLLSYPRNINYTECCNQPMCTSCFVKIKRPNSGRVISCPFCNHVNFSILYRKPRWLAELTKSEDQRDLTIKPDPVACEAVKKVVPAHERIQRIHSQHQQRTTTQPRYYYANRGNSSGAVPRRYVFYEPSGSYTFYDNQYYRSSVPDTPAPTNPSYYQHYQQQEYQRQQTLRARAEAYERQQLEEAINRSMNECGEATEQYTSVNPQ